MSKKIPIELLSIMIEFINTAKEEFDHEFNVPKDYRYDDIDDCHILYIDDELLYWDKDFSNLSGELNRKCKDVGETVYVFLRIGGE